MLYLKTATLAAIFHKSAAELSADASDALYFATFEKWQTAFGNGKVRVQARRWGSGFRFRLEPVSGAVCGCCKRDTYEPKPGAFALCDSCVSGGCLTMKRAH